MSLFKKKSFEEVRVSGNNSGLEKTLSGVDLILLGLGAIVGTGVFVYTGMVASQYSGPAVVLSYIIAGITCMFVAMVYTELSAMLPTSGSIYSYGYVAFGEFIAWLLTGTVVLEFVFGAAAVSAGWSGYIQSIFKAGGIELPHALTHVPFDGGIVNLPALFIVSFVCLVLCMGTSESKKLNAALVFIKMGSIFVFMVAAVPHFDIHNFDEFMPFGWGSTMQGASILFFAFCGFGQLASTAEECKNPKRDLMVGIIGSLSLAVLTYVLVAGLAVGIAPYAELNNPSPLAHALQLNGSNIGSAIVATGAVCGMTTVIMVNLFAQSRIAYVIGRDGLLPKMFTKLDKHGNPKAAIIFFSMIAALLGGFFPFNTIGKLSSMGGILDYIGVIVAALVFRSRYAKMERPFSCPAIWAVGMLALLSCVYLLSTQIYSIEDGVFLPEGRLFFGWFVFLAVLYFIRKAVQQKELASSSVVAK